MKCTKFVSILLLLMLIVLSSGCVDQHGFKVGQKIQTTTEYREATNKTFVGTIILIENNRNPYDQYAIDHYIITAYNQSLNSKQSFNEEDIVPERK